MGLNSWTFSPFQRWQNQYDQERNTTTKQQFPFLIPDEKTKISHVQGVRVGIGFSNAVYQLSSEYFSIGSTQEI